MMVLLCSQLWTWEMLQPDMLYPDSTMKQLITICNVHVLHQEKGMKCEMGLNLLRLIRFGDHSFLRI